MTDDINPQKLAFARAWLSDIDNPYKAALSVMGDAAAALPIAKLWPTDPDVLAIIDGMPPEERDGQGVPTDNDMIREIWLRVRATIDHELAFKGIDTIRKIRDKTNGASVAINAGNTQINNNVMVVVDHGTDTEWETSLRAQQAKLVNDSTEKARVN